MVQDSSLQIAKFDISSSEAKHQHQVNRKKACDDWI
jgi:hypothetical protein